jgi:hypothetical protein
VRRAARGAGLVAGLLPALVTGAGAGPYTEAGYLPASVAAWATSVEEIARGPVDNTDPSSLAASFGDPAFALGPALGDDFDVVSLGDGGHVTLGFASGISDGPGDDFAVYENGFFGFGAFFAELAFVEVSSNGVDFARFDATSLGTEPVPDGGVVDWTDYHNLAGKHPKGEGTGFDLAELAGHPLVSGGLLDLDDVVFVRVVDVIGDGSTTDHVGAPVYDPHTTPYPSGGPDLEAIGVLHVPEAPFGALLGAGALLATTLARRRRPACRASR